MPRRGLVSGISLHQQLWYGDASLLVGFKLMPLEPQFQKTVETKYPVGNEGLPGGNGRRWGAAATGRGRNRRRNRRPIRLSYVRGSE